jgi:hypothetical protein
VRLLRALGHYLFGEVLADGFAFAVGVGREVDGFGLFGRALQFGDDPTVVALLRVGYDLVGRLEIVLNVTPRPFAGKSLMWPMEAITRGSPLP